MKQQDVFWMVSLCALLCFAGRERCGANENQAAEDPQLAQLYVRLMGTSQ